MRIEVDYDGRTYGAGSNAPEYVVEIAHSYRPNGIKVKFAFKSPTSGQSESWYSDASVKGGALYIPTAQAVAMAEAILAVAKLQGVNTRETTIRLHLTEETS